MASYFGFIIILMHLIIEISSIPHGTIGLLPATGQQSAKMIFLHGLSGDSDSWAKKFRESVANFRTYVDIVLPNAQTRRVSILMGRISSAWYNLFGVDENSVEDEAGIEQATAYVHGIIDQQISWGTSVNRIVVGGFSQGAALALYAGLTYNQTLGGIVDLSGYLPLHNKITQTHSLAQKATPILIGHGQSDPLIPLRLAQITAQKVSAFNPNITIKVYQTVHGTTGQEMSDLSAFIETNVPSK